MLPDTDPKKTHSYTTKRAGLERMQNEQFKVASRKRSLQAYDELGNLRPGMFWRKNRKSCEDKLPKLHTQEIKLAKKYVEKLHHLLQSLCGCEQP